MELASKSLLAIDVEQEENSMGLNRTTDIDLLNDCQNQMEESVTIYNNDSQNEEAEKVVTSLESKSDLMSMKTVDDISDLITLHPRPSQAKSEISHEDVSGNNTDNSKLDILNKSEETEIESDDDETIATFVTSTGQQLALYAVEDSDEIFAVALYDESGEPPTNFHFLMKEDVERLIGEGAVKTVKKPSAQTNKESKTPEAKEEVKNEKLELVIPSPSPEKKEENQFEKLEDIKTEIVEVPPTQKVQENKIQNIEQINSNIKNDNVNKNNIATKQLTFTNTSKTLSNVQVTKEKEANIAYVSNDCESYIIDNSQEDIDSDAEIIEQSTVQYILCDGDHSDTELTFDELQASLQSFKMNKSVSSVNKRKSPEPKLQKLEKKKDHIIKFSSYQKSSQKVVPMISQKKESMITVHRTYKNPKKARMTNNLLQAHRKIKRELEDPSYDFQIFEDGQNSSDDMSKSKQNSSIIENSPNAVKVKRSRKQQLTVVNRTDSEIIIQPASVFSEEEEEPVIVKKRGRRKKKILPDPDYNPRRPIRKSRRSYRSVEVIEIDIDESERSNIPEVTLDGNKGKGSSDKENDIISVGDSEEDEENMKLKKPMLQCNHCMRYFRKRRGLARHLQACPKSPANIQKLEEQKKLISQGKRFKCKSCDEMFDIAVALARHVRVVHSPRKRGRPPKNWSKDDQSETTETEDSMEESSPEPEPEPKRRGRPPNKRRFSKDESSISDMELKLESSIERVFEPRKRGRPPGRKNFAKERSLTPDSEERHTSVQEISTEPRKRGRPSKRSFSKEERSITPDIEEKIENLQESIVQIPKKRGRPSKKHLIKEDRLDTSRDQETEEKTENSIETPTEPRKRGRPSKRSISKDESSITLEVLEDSETLTEHKTKNNRSMTPELEEKNEKFNQVLKEIPKKRRFSKDSFTKDEKSSTPEVDDLIESSVETLGEPRKRGRPPKDASKDELSKISEIDEKTESSTETPIESRRRGRPPKDISKDESSEVSEVDEKLNETPVETRKRGRPAKDASSKEYMSEISEVDDKIENSPETQTEPRKRGRPAKDAASKEESKISETDEKIEILAEIPSEPRKRGRPPKDASSKEETSETSEVDEKIENSTETSVEPRKRGRPPKDASSKEETSETSEVDEKIENSTETSVEPRKRGRPPKDASSKEETSETSEVDEKIENSTETSIESRKRGRPTKDSSKNKVTEILLTDEKIKNLTETFVESRKKDKLIQDTKDEMPQESEISEKIESSIKLSEESLDKDRLPKDESSKDDILEILEIEEHECLSETPIESQEKDKEDSREKMSKGDLTETQIFCEKLETPEIKTNIDNLTETLTETNKKDKLSKDMYAKNEIQKILETDINIESPTEIAAETWKRNKLSKDENLETIETELKSENTKESFVQHRKRGRPCKEKISKDNQSETVEMDIENLTGDIKESWKRGRSNKDMSLKNNQSEITKTKLNIDSSIEDSEECQKKSKLNKDESSMDEKVKLEIENVEKTMESLFESEEEDSASKDATSTDYKLENEEINIKTESSTKIPSSSLKEEQKSETLLSDDKSDSTDATVLEPEVKIKNSPEILVVARKRGRPSKDQCAIDDKQADELKLETEIKVDNSIEFSKEQQENKSLDQDSTNKIKLSEIKSESSSETLVVIRKRGRPSKDISSTDEKSESLEKEIKIETTSDTPVLLRKRGRPSKDRPSAEEVSENPESDIKVENSSTTSAEFRKRGRPAKDKSSKDETSVEHEEKEAETSKESAVNEDRAKNKSKLQNPNRTWKVKKLNCVDCGKWFSSAAALTTHRLNHRTKKSGLLVKRCPICRKIIPTELFTKHLTTLHGKPSKTVLPKRRTRTRPVARSMRSKTLRSSN